MKRRRNHPSLRRMADILRKVASATGASNFPDAPQFGSIFLGQDERSCRNARECWIYKEGPHEWATTNAVTPNMPGKIDRIARMLRDSFGWSTYYVDHSWSSSDHTPILLTRV